LFIVPNKTAHFHKFFFNLPHSTHQHQCNRYAKAPLAMTEFILFQVVMAAMAFGLTLKNSTAFLNSTTILNQTIPLNKTTHPFVSSTCKSTIYTDFNRSEEFVIESANVYYTVPGWYQVDGVPNLQPRYLYSGFHKGYDGNMYMDMIAQCANWIDTQGGDSETLSFIITEYDDTDYSGQTLFTCWADLLHFYHPDLLLPAYPTQNPANEQ
jgi:hypothetical protein